MWVHCKVPCRCRVPQRVVTSATDLTWIWKRGEGAESSWPKLWPMPTSCLWLQAYLPCTDIPPPEGNLWCFVFICQFNESSFGFRFHLLSLVSLSVRPSRSPLDLSFLRHVNLSLTCLTVGPSSNIHPRPLCMARERHSDSRFAYSYLSIFWWAGRVAINHWRCTHICLFPLIDEDGSMSIIRAAEEWEAERERTKLKVMRVVSEHKLSWI